MKSNIFLRVIIGCLFFLVTNVCQAQTLSDKEALDFAVTKGKELLMAFQEPNLEKRYKVLDDMALTYIDIDYISRFVVGKYWRQMTREQQMIYKDIFVRYGLAFYKTLPLDFAKNLTYDINGAATEGKFVNVATTVNLNLGKEPQSISLIFRLHKVDGIVKAVDVKVAESSMLLAYRSKFYEMLAQADGEVEWFLEDLELLTSTMENNLRENVSNQQNLLEVEE